MEARDGEARRMAEYALDRIAEHQRECAALQRQTRVGLVTLLVGMLTVIVMLSVQLAQ